MKGFPVDLTGIKFTRLTVINRVPSKNKNSRWLCQCDCGNFIESDRSPLTGGDSRSCGCLKREKTIAKFTTHGQSGKNETREHKTWTTMLARCRNPKNHKYPRYGGRGIRVCDRWLKFENFFADMGVAPEGFTIERKNNDGDYEPDNCIWIPHAQQARNRSTNVLIEYNGETMIALDWANRLGMGLSGFLGRLKKWPIERVMTEPIRTWPSGKPGPRPGNRSTAADI